MPVTWIDTPGVALYDRYDRVDFSVEDSSTVTVVAQLRGGAVSELVWWEGAFVAPYLASSETAGVFSVKRDGGWPSDVSIMVREDTMGGSPIWEWNGVDTSQFDATDDVYLTTLTSPLISVVSDAASPSGNTLRFSATSPSSGSSKVCHFAPITQVFEPGRYRVEIVTAETDALSSSYRGLWLLGEGVDAGHWSWALICGGGTASWKYRIEAGVLVGDSNTIHGLAGGNCGASSEEWQDLRISSRKGSGVPPVFTHQASATIAASPYQTTGGSHLFFATPAAGWNALTCDRLGIALRHADSGTGSLFWDIRELRVYAT